MAKSEHEGNSRTTTKKTRNWPLIRKRLTVYLTFFLLICLVLSAYLFNRIFINIYPGQAGVYWLRFRGGTVLNYVYNEGLHIIPPWNKMYVYDTRIQHRPFAFDALSKDGLRIRFDVSALYMPDREYLPQLHTQVGPDYVNKVVKPEVQAQLRKVVANYLPDEIYTSEGYILQIIKQGTLGVLAEKHIVLDDLLIRKMNLPQTIVDAIEKKLAQEQRVKEYTYLLQCSVKEAQRKAIEAEGIKRFQDIVKSSNFFEKYLQFKGINATVDLAKSNNSKVVIIGGGKGKLPLIMNMETTPTAPVLEKTPTATPAEPIAPPLINIDSSQPVSPQLPPKTKNLETESSFFSRLQDYIKQDKLWQLPEEASEQKRTDSR
jgi:regulator of protease activity HflC (stomatin/prohibitin superfamily)